MSIFYIVNISWKHFNGYMIIHYHVTMISFIYCFPVVWHWCCFHFPLLNRDTIVVQFILVFRSVSALEGWFLKGVCFLEMLDVYCWTVKHVHTVNINVAQSDWLHHVTVSNCTCKDSIIQCFNEKLALRVTFHKNKIFLMKWKIVTQ